MDRPFKPKYSTVSQVLLQLVVAGYEELAVGFEPIKSREIFVTVKYKTNTS